MSYVSKLQVMRLLPFPRLAFQSVPFTSNLFSIFSMLIQDTIQFRHIFTCSLRFVLILLFSQIQEADAADYYFSSVAGNDNRTTTEAQNPSTPWQSIAKLNEFFADLKPGDRILFKRGNEFFGTIRIDASGITLGSYGEGSKPVITGMKKIEQWEHKGSGIYYTTLDGMESKELSVVLLQGEVQQLGRYPNSDAANGGYLVQSHSVTPGKVTGPGIPFNAEGAEIVLRKNNWIIDRFPVDNHDNGTFSFTDDSIYPVDPDYGFFIQKSLATLDHFGEWYYDPSDKRLYMFFGEVNPTGQVVEVALKESLVTMKDKTARIAIRLEELDFKGANRNILDLNRVFDLQIKKCEIRYAGRDGIYLYETPSTTIEDNSFQYCLNNSIFFWYGGTKAQVRGNRIMHTMPFPGMSQNSDLNGIGIYMAADSDGSIIEENQLISTGYTGIYFGGDHVTIRKNLIDDFCKLKFDGGGIYTTSQGLLDRNQTDRLVEHNIVLNGKGIPYGTPLEGNLAEGIYLDDNARGLIVRNNTVANIDSRGIYLHNARNTKIEGNILFNNKYDIYLSHDQFGNPVRSLEISGNYFLSKNKNYRFFGISSISDDISEVGLINNNYYLDPFSTEFLYQAIPFARHPPTDRNISDWSKTYGYDSLSDYRDFNYSTVDISSGKILKESDFSAGIGIIAGTYNGSSTLNNSGKNAAMLQVNTQEKANTTLFIQLGKVGIGDQIWVESEASMSRANKKISLFLERTQKATPSSFPLGFAGTPEFSQNKILLTSAVSSGNESVVISIPPDAGEVLFKMIRISKVAVTPRNIDEKIFFKYNYSDAVVPHELPGLYIDGAGEQFSGLVNIPPYSAKLLVKVD